MSELLQAYPSVTPFEQLLLGEPGQTFRHVLVVRAGDHRFARTWRRSLPENARLVTLESRQDLLPVDAPECLGGEWEREALDREVAEHGPFDLILFLHFHEYWYGQVGTLARYLDHLDIAGAAWFQFLNGSCLETLDRRFRALDGAGLLTDPNLRGSPVDLTGLIQWSNQFGLLADFVWGYTEDRLFDWIEGKRKKDYYFEFLKRRIPASKPVEAISVGARVLAVRVRRRRARDPETLLPEVRVARARPQGIQSFLVPHPQVDDREIATWQALRQVRAWQAGRRPMLSPFRERFLGFYEPDAKTRRVLLVGGAVGGDWMLFAEKYPQWEWTAVDHQEETVSLWREAFPEEARRLHRWDPADPFPFEDGQFDLVISAGAFSRCNPSLLLRYLQEMVRVSSQSVGHLENRRGPELDPYLRAYPLERFYERLGVSVRPNPLETPSGESGWCTFYIEKHLGEPIPANESVPAET